MGGGLLSRHWPLRLAVSLNVTVANRWIPGRFTMRHDNRAEASSIYGCDFKLKPAGKIGRKLAGKLVDAECSKNFHFPPCKLSRAILR